MKRLFAIFLVLWSLPTAAAVDDPIDGPATVVDGDHLRVGGRVVRLYGIDAPDPGQRCPGPDRIHDCGHIAATGLMDLTAGLTRVNCEALGTGPDGITIARCRDSLGFDLSRQMLYTGWAFASPAAAAGFHAEEQRARTARRGMWKWQVTPPWVWRQKPDAGATAGQRSDRRTE